MSLLRTAARVGVASSVHGRVQNRQRQQWAAQQQAAAAPPAPVPAIAAAPAAAAPAGEDPLVTQLKQLAGLRDAGILTEAEFSAKKAQLLGI